MLRAWPIHVIRDTICAVFPYRRMTYSSLRKFLACRIKQARQKKLNLELITYNFDIILVG